MTHQGLTPLEQRFVEEYLVDMNGSRAVLRAGFECNECSARVTACRLLTKANIKAAVAAARRERSNRTRITADRVLRLIYERAFADISGAFDWSGGTQKLKPAKDIPRKVRRLARKIELKADGTVKWEAYPAEVYINLLCRHVGICQGKDAADGLQEAEARFLRSLRDKDDGRPASTCQLRQPQNKWSFRTP
jgi:phage terminase small subunit